MRLALLLLLALPLAAQDSPQSWWWVHGGLAVYAAGTAADATTSYGYPEENGLLRQNGTFGTRGAVLKLAAFGATAAVSYTLGWKWPKMRRALGIIDGACGVTFGVMAVRNSRQ
jgi:hypothetical protein